MAVLLLQVFLPQCEHRNVSRHCPNFIIVKSWKHPGHLAPEPNFVGHRERYLQSHKIGTVPTGKPGLYRQGNRDCPGRTSEKNEIANRMYICWCALQVVNLGGASPTVPCQQTVHTLHLLHSRQF